MRFLRTPELILVHLFLISMAPTGWRNGSPCTQSTIVLAVSIWRDDADVCLWEGVACRVPTLLVTCRVQKHAIHICCLLLGIQCARSKLTRITQIAPL